MNRTPPKSRKRFAEFTPTDPATMAAETLDRSTLKGLPPAEAAERLVEFHRQRTTLRGITAAQKGVVLRKVLGDLAERGIDLSNLTKADVALYREYLRQCVADGVISQSYASHVTAQWNSVMGTCFGDNDKPGTGLRMRGFQQKPRPTQRIDGDEFEAILGAAKIRRFRTEHDREAFITYLEVEWPSAARIGSLVGVRDPERPEDEVEALRFSDIDWEKGIARLRHMKNVPEHEVLLTPRALTRLRWWRDYLRKTPLWKGEDTKVLIDQRGRPYSSKGMNDKLRSLAALAGIRKRVRTHDVRKSAGTLIAKENPRYAREQLGITAKVFEAHYNQPTIEDRMERRDILPGADWTPKTPEEIVGHAYLEFSRGKLSRQGLEEALARAESIRVVPSVGKWRDPSYV